MLINGALNNALVWYGEYCISIHYFYYSDIDNPTLVATSNVVKFLNPSEPLQGHLMLTNDPTQIKLESYNMEYNSSIMV